MHVRLQCGRPFRIRIPDEFESCPLLFSAMFAGNLKG